MAEGNKSVSLRIALFIATERNPHVIQHIPILSPDCSVWLAPTTGHGSSDHPRDERKHGEN